jgi:hypothetical protein
MTAFREDDSDDDDDGDAVLEAFRDPAGLPALPPPSLPPLRPLPAGPPLRIFPELRFGFDWTYTSPYQGHASLTRPHAPDDSLSADMHSPRACAMGLCDRACACPADDPEGPAEDLPVPGPAPGVLQWHPSPWLLPTALLARQVDPILWYACVRLFEDELHDNGTSVLEAKIRVMEHSWLLLLRLFVRVDGVVLRVRETRYCYCFQPVADAPPPTHVLRETRVMEARWEDLPRLGMSSDPAKHCDADQVARMLPVTYSRLDCAELCSAEAARAKK